MTSAYDLENVVRFFARLVRNIVLQQNIHEINYSHHEAPASEKFHDAQSKSQPYYNKIQYQNEYQKRQRKNPEHFDVFCRQLIFQLVIVEI